MTVQLVKFDELESEDLTVNLITNVSNLLFVDSLEKYLDVVRKEESLKEVVVDMELHFDVRITLILNVYCVIYQGWTNWLPNNPGQSGNSRDDILLYFFRISGFFISPA